MCTLSRWVILLIVYAALVLTMLLFVARRRGWIKRGVLARLVTHVRTSWVSMGMQPIIKQLIAFYQVVASIPSVYNVSLPDGKYAAWVLVLEWPSLILGDIFAPPECLSGGYFFQLLLSSFWPWALSLVVMLGFALRSSLQLCRGIVTLRCVEMSSVGTKVVQFTNQRCCILRLNAYHA